MLTEANEGNIFLDSLLNAKRAAASIAHYRTCPPPIGDDDEAELEDDDFEEIADEDDGDEHDDDEDGDDEDDLDEDELDDLDEDEEE
jgi:hypothetical protein